MQTDEQNQAVDLPLLPPVSKADYDTDTLFTSLAVVSVSNPKGILTPDTDRLPVVWEPNSPRRFDTAR